MKTSCKTLDSVLDNKMSVLLARKNEGFHIPSSLDSSRLSPPLNFPHESPGQSSHPPHPNILTLSSSQPPVFLFTTHSFRGSTQSSHLCDFSWLVSLWSHLNVFLERVIVSFGKELFTVLSYCLISSVLLCTSHMSDIPVGWEWKENLGFLFLFFSSKNVAYIKRYSLNKCVYKWMMLYCQAKSVRSVAKGRFY